MRFNVLLIATILCDLALATYDIYLYKNTECKGSIGQTCSKVEAGACCSRASAKPGQGFSKWGSAKFKETGGRKSTDQLKAYQDHGSDACGMPVVTSNTCA